MSEAFLTPPQVAEFLGVNVNKVLRWIDRGELRASNLADRHNGKRPRWKISRQALETFLAGRTPAAPQPRKPRRKREAYRPQFFSEAGT